MESAQQQTGRAAPMYLVERYWPGVTSQVLDAAIARLADAAAEMTVGGTAVRHVQSTLVAGDETVLCLFEATSPDAVQELNRRAGMEVDRITPCLSFPAKSATSGRSLLPVKEA